MVRVACKKDQREKAHRYCVFSSERDIIVYRELD